VQVTTANARRGRDATEGGLALLPEANGVWTKARGQGSGRHRGIASAASRRRPAARANACTRGSTIGAGTARGGADRDRTSAPAAGAATRPTVSSAHPSVADSRLAKRRRAPAPARAGWGDEVTIIRRFDAAHADAFDAAPTQRFPNCNRGQPGLAGAEPRWFEGRPVRQHAERPDEVARPGGTPTAARVLHERRRSRGRGQVLPAEWGYGFSSSSSSCRSRRVPCTYAQNADLRA
jgi:hypothetical protein